MKKQFIKLISIIITLIILLTLWIPGTIGINQNKYNISSENETNFNPEYQELDLLYGEIAFFIIMDPTVDKPFNITYSLPPNYMNQAPIMFEIKKDTNANILNYEIINDNDSPNRAIKFNIAPDFDINPAFINFDFWVLIANNDFKDMPNYEGFPNDDDLPDSTKIWLQSTKAVQSNSTLIKLKAQNLRNKCQNISCLADKIVKYTATHKPIPLLWSIINLILMFKFPGWAKYLDAQSSLFFGGSCTGRANLGTALFRANNIPARVLHVLYTPPYSFYKNNEDWYDMHYISEYYVPDYNWVLAETVLGIAPLEQRNVIVLRINYPDDENLAGNKVDYYGGCEPWFWIDEPKINIMWNVRHSGTRSWFNNNMTIDILTADYIFNLTKNVYDKFLFFTDDDLTDTNQYYYENAFQHQKNAIDCFEEYDIGGYIVNITQANSEYEKIIS